MRIIKFKVEKLKKLKKMENIADCHDQCPDDEMYFENLELSYSKHEDKNKFIKTVIKIKKWVNENIPIRYFN